jgi:hypothetical protein
MSTAKSSPPWYAPWRRASRLTGPPEADDPADLGTAFGLDLATPPPSGMDEPAARAEWREAGRWVQRPGGRGGRD